MPGCFPRFRGRKKSKKKVDEETVDEMVVDEGFANKYEEWMQSQGSDLKNSKYTNGSAAAPSSSSSTNRPPPLPSTRPPQPVTSSTSYFPPIPRRDSEEDLVPHAPSIGALQKEDTDSYAPTPPPRDDLFDGSTEDEEDIYSTNEVDRNGSTLKMEMPIEEAPPENIVPLHVVESGRSSSERNEEVEGDHEVEDSNRTVSETNPPETWEKPPRSQENLPSTPVRSAQRKSVTFANISEFGRDFSESPEHNSSELHDAALAQGRGSSLRTQSDSPKSPPSQPQHFPSTVSQVQSRPTPSSPSSRHGVSQPIVLRRGSSQHVPPKPTTRPMPPVRNASANLVSGRPIPPVRNASANLVSGGNTSPWTGSRSPNGHFITARSGTVAPPTPEHSHRGPPPRRIFRSQTQGVGFSQAVSERRERTEQGQGASLNSQQSSAQKTPQRPSRDVQKFEIPVRRISSAQPEQQAGRTSQQHQQGARAATSCDNSTGLAPPGYSGDQNAYRNNSVGDDWSEESTNGLQRRYGYSTSEQNSQPMSGNRAAGQKSRPLSGNSGAGHRIQARGEGYSLSRRGSQKYPTSPSQPQPEQAQRRHSVQVGRGRSGGQSGSLTQGSPWRHSNASQNGFATPQRQPLSIPLSPPTSRAPTCWNRQPSQTMSHQPSPAGRSGGMGAEVQDVWGAGVSGENNTRDALRRRLSTVGKGEQRPPQNSPVRPPSQHYDREPPQIMSHAERVRQKVSLFEVRAQEVSSGPGDGMGARSLSQNRISRVILSPNSPARLSANERIQYQQELSRLKRELDAGQMSFEDYMSQKNAIIDIVSGAL